MAQIILKCTHKQPVVWKCAHNETSSAHTNIRTNTAIPEEFVLEGILPKEVELVQTQRFWNYSNLVEMFPESNLASTRSRTDGFQDLRETINFLIHVL
jgi:hypothetical protein